MAFDISIVLTAKNNANAAFRQTERNLRGLRSSLNKTSKAGAGMGKRFKAIGGKMKAVGQSLTRNVTLPIVGLGALALRTTLKFETAMNKVSAVTQATAEQMAAMEKVARKMGATTEFSAGQAAEAMTFLAQAGLEVDQVMGALPGVLQLASAGGLDLAQAADIATNVMTSMGKEVKDLAKINDILALAQAKSNTNISELAEALRPVAGTASTVGIELTELTALLGKMADAGNKGGLSGTLLRNAILKIVNPTQKTSATLKALGINIKDFITKGGKIKNFTKLVDQLAKKGATTGQIFKIFGERGARAILDLQKSGGPAIRKLTKELENSEGTAADMQERMQMGLPGAVNRLKSSFEGLMITIGKKLVPIFTRITERIIKAIEWWDTLDEGTKDLILSVAGFLALLGPLLVAIGSLSIAMATLSAVSSPITGTILLVVAAVALTIAIFVKWEDMSLKVKIALFVLFAPLVGLIFLIKQLIKLFDFVFGQTDKVIAQADEVAAAVELQKLFKGGKNGKQTIETLAKDKSSAEVDINVSASGGLRATVIAEKAKGAMKIATKAATSTLRGTVINRP